MAYLICTVIILEMFMQSLVAYKLPGEPLIYPRKADVTVDSGTDLTLGCRGIEPMRWSFHDDINGPYYNTTHKNVSEIHNKKEVEYKYETILTLYNVSHVNVGFYYCHGKIAFFNTARRASKIYVFVKDDKYLSVNNSEGNTFAGYNWNFFIPCRPTSQDINITISCNYGTILLSVNPGNYSVKRQHKKFVSRFHPYHGFTVDLLKSAYISFCFCTFEKNNISFRMYLKRDFKVYFHSYNIMTIEGPATADVGDDITLQCIILVNQYFQYDKHWPQWDTSITGNIQAIKLQTHVLLVNSLTIKNISADNEGYYECRMKYDWKIYAESKHILVNGSDDKKSNYSAPRIYSPNGGEIQINSGENITLRCAGSLPVTWERSRTFIRAHFSEIAIVEHLLNLTSGLNEAHLHIMAARYLDTDLYECKENYSMPNQPLKSVGFYIYVKDEHNPYVPDKDFQIVSPYTVVVVPCLPTSRDVNVSFSMMFTSFDPITRRWAPPLMITPVIHAYDPREGFTVQILGPGDITATCRFVTETRNDTRDIEYHILGYNFTSEPVITGPAEDLVFVGQTLELSCSVAVWHNVPDDALSWTPPNHNTSSEAIREITRINLDGGKVLISKLILQDVKDTNEGSYFCHLSSNNATVGKVISVHDPFIVKLFIEDLQYDYAYIGRPVILRCRVNITHNVGYQMFWTTPNSTDIRVKNMDIEYNLNVRNTYSEIILKIDNVTNENAGNYTCTLYYSTNRKNATTKNILIKSGNKPSILSNFKNHADIDVHIDETANLTCIAEGDPKPVITWMKGSNEVRRIGQHIGFANNNSELTVHYVQRIDEGLYTCVAQNPFGRDFRNVNLHIKTASYTSYITVSVFLIVLFAVAVTFFARRLFRQKKLQKELIKAAILNFQNGEKERLNAILNLGDQASNLPYDYRWEIPRSSIELGRNLGSGYFGLVVEATVSNFFDGEPEKTVAVKMLHRNRNFIELNSLICELKIMAHLGEHANLINLLGASTANIGEGNLLVVIEYCANGCLRNYLRENRSNFINLIDPNTELISLPADYNHSMQALAGCDVSTLQLLHWTLQVARGMEFLAARQVLHGDLAARNILLDENYVAKISDFGMSKTLSSRGYYKKKSQCPLPIKWMAIESIRDKTFSTQSDVWAFGVVVWELFSLARTPYAELEPDFRFYRKLESGYRLERPHYSTKEIYQVMRECWCVQPQCRPTFPCLVSTLTDLLQEPNKRYSADLESGSDDASSGAHSITSSILAVGQADPTAAPDWIALDILPSTSSVQGVLVTRL